jgi:energy-coupling factor transporter ATP-binding protein EcfA2
MTETISPAVAHAVAVTKVMSHIESDTRAIVVNSPPGAGKSTLVRAVARQIVQTGTTIPIITQTNDQADDHVRALRQSGLRIGRLHAHEYNPGRHPDNHHDLRQLQGCDIVVAPAAKWATLHARENPDWSPRLGIIDEAYQMSSAALAAVADFHHRLLLVGDPGQLSPFTTADMRTLRSSITWPLDTAAHTVLTKHPASPQVELPVTWRLPPTTARLVARAFYRQHFTSGLSPEQRRLSPLGLVRDAYDQAIHAAAEHSICMLELPDEHVALNDPDMTSAIATLVTRLLTRRITIINGEERRPLDARDIAVGVVHTEQRDRIQYAVDTTTASLGVAAGDILVDTANRLQGREFEVVIALHPLSGRRDATEFHLEAGRLCVLTSRHRTACIVITRAGIQRQLHGYPHTQPVWLNAPRPPMDGWAANRTFLDDLRCIASIALPTDSVIPRPR